jgi:AraC family transcriptional regulator
MGLALKRVLESEGKASRLYAETMCNALIVHLLQHYSSHPPRLREVRGGLPRHKLQQVIDYIQAHLERDLGIHELAQVVQISPHYFSRLFKQSTGFTPHQYVIRCRVYRAKGVTPKDIWQ